MAKKVQTKYNHKKYYASSANRKLLPKFNINSGMIINFKYSGGSDSKPLVFVMDTEEYKSPEKRNFSGINLNYLPIGDVNKLFLRMLSRVGWEYSKTTKMPKVDLYDEENPGVRPIVLYESFIKKQLLNRRDCWRTYKYMKCSLVEQIKFDFDVPPLNKIAVYKPLGKITEKQMHQKLADTRYGKTQGTVDED